MGHIDADISIIIRWSDKCDNKTTKDFIKAVIQSIKSVKKNAEKINKCYSLYGAMSLWVIVRGYI